MGEIWEFLYLAYILSRPIYKVNEAIDCPLYLIQQRVIVILVNFIKITQCTQGILEDSRPDLIFSILRRSSGDIKMINIQHLHNPRQHNFLNLNLPSLLKTPITNIHNSHTKIHLHQWRYRTKLNIFKRS